MVYEQYKNPCVSHGAINSLFAFGTACVAFTDSLRLSSCFTLLPGSGFVEHIKLMRFTSAVTMAMTLNWVFVTSLAIGFCKHILTFEGGNVKHICWSLYRRWSLLHLVILPLAPLWFLFFSEWMDELPWNVVQVSMLSRGGVVITFHLASLSGKGFHVLKYLLNAFLTNFLDIHVSQRTKRNDFGDLLNFLLAPPWYLHLWLCVKYLYNHWTAIEFSLDIHVPSQDE